MNEILDRQPVRWVAVALMAALLGFAGGWAWQWTGWGRTASDEAMRQFILENPEILPEAMSRLEARERAERLGSLGEEVKTPFPGAVLGNPDGAIALVEFSDFACGYCRKSVEEVEALIAANPDLKVVVRELPILSSQSVDAARMALAAAEQGRYEAFYRAMFDAGRPSAESIAAAASTAGLDMARAKKFARSPQVDMELARNMSIANKLGFNGTPSWVVGDQAFSGAVGQQALQGAIAQARGS